MAACIGVDSRVTKNRFQHAETEDIPCQLGVSRLVVVQMSHHLSLLEMHVSSNRPVLRRSYVGISLTFLYQILPCLSNLHSQVYVDAQN